MLNTTNANPKATTSACCGACDCKNCTCGCEKNACDCKNRNCDCGCRKSDRQ